jgi:hypothetical protein
MLLCGCFLCPINGYLHVRMLTASFYGKDMMFAVLELNDPDRNDDRTT